MAAEAIAEVYDGNGKDRSMTYQDYLNQNSHTNAPKPVRPSIPSDLAANLISSTMMEGDLLIHWGLFRVLSDVSL